MSIISMHRPGASRSGALVIAFASALGMSHDAMAQAIERNLPQAPVEQPESITPPNVVPANEDDTPLGPILSGLVLLSADEDVKTAPGPGLDTGFVSRLNNQGGRAALQGFIGRPLSRKLIAEIEAAIARQYRQEGFPFVSLSTPPQKIGSGVLQVRVIEFYSGQVTIHGASGPEAGFVRGRIRLQTGDAIDAPLLSEDLDWLNRYPFRHADAVFEPGDALGRSDLALNLTESKPWSVFAGYANSGSPETGWARYLVGAEVGGLLTPDSLLSYQFTASSDFWVKNGELFGESSHPRYMSHGVRLVVPTDAREEIEATFDHVETNASAYPFSVRQLTDELSVGYRMALSNYIRLSGDVSGGIEIKREQRKTLFIGIYVLDNAVDIYQAYAGWSDIWNDRWGRGNANITIHTSPGGINNQNNSNAFALFSNGRVTAAGYAYVNAQTNHYTRIGGQWAISTALIGQYAAGALPDTEQLGVGGQGLVRGFTLDDGSYDSAVVVRNELRTPTFPLFAKWTGFADRLSPFAFIDAGYGTANVVHRNVTPASVGAGADYQLADRITADLMTAYAIDRGAQTRSGALRFLMQTRIAF